MSHSDPLIASRTALALLERLPRQEAGQVVLVSSVARREGKSFVSRMLAIELAAGLDGRLAQVSTAPDTTSASPTLAGLLAGEAWPPGEGPQGARGTCAQVAAGSMTPELLFHAHAVEQALDTLRGQFQLTVIDGPELGACGALLRHADSVVLVVDSRRTSPHAVRSSLATANIERERIAGVVLNRAPAPLPAWLGGD